MVVPTCEFHSLTNLDILLLLLPRWQWWPEGWATSSRHCSVFRARRKAPRLSLGEGSRETLQYLLRDVEICWRTKYGIETIQKQCIKVDNFLKAVIKSKMLTKSSITNSDKNLWIWNVNFFGYYLNSTLVSVGQIYQVRQQACAKKYFGGFDW